MTRYWIAAIALLMLSCLSLAQTPGSDQTQPTTTVPTFTLSSGEVHRVATSRFNYNSHECDAQGNILFNLFGGLLDAGNFLLVSRNGQDVTKLPLPLETSDPVEWHPSVSSDGSLYLIYSNFKDPEQQRTLFQIDSTGKEISRSNLQLPFGFHTETFAVLADGRSLFFGEISAGGNTPKTSWLFWFDPSGRLIRKLEADKQFNPATDSTETAITAGPAGTFLVASPKEIRIFDAHGEKVQTYPISARKIGSLVTSVQFLDGKIAVEFLYPIKEIPDDRAQDDGKPSPPLKIFQQIWLVLNGLTGEPEAFYELPKDLPAGSLCYLGQHSFLLFTTSKDGIPILVEANE